jgi:hypothetical protein
VITSQTTFFMKQEGEAPYIFFLIKSIEVIYKAEVKS